MRYLHMSCCKDTDEDRGTVQYLQDCAEEAQVTTDFVFIEDLGLGERGELTDLQDQIISNMFKLYPWEFMFREDFSTKLADAGIRWLEPSWKSIISNKALLPMLWEMFLNTLIFYLLIFMMAKRLSHYHAMLSSHCFHAKVQIFVLLKMVKILLSQMVPTVKKALLSKISTHCRNLAIAIP